MMKKGTRVRLIKDLTAGVLFHYPSSSLSADVVYVPAGTEGKIVSESANLEGLDDILFDSHNDAVTEIHRWWVNTEEYVERVQKTK
jgi:hypothetical protein